MRILGGKISTVPHWRLGILLFLLVAALAARAWCPFGLVLVAGKSMEPTLRRGQLLLLDRGQRQASRLRLGDIVSFWQGGRRYVKRVVAVGPQTVWELQGSSAPNIIVPPAQLAKARQWLARYPDSGVLVPVPVPAGTVFLVGDNGCNSYDSRDFGPVPLAQVIGKVSPVLKGRQPAKVSAFKGDPGKAPVLFPRRSGQASAALRQNAADRATTPG
jgi:signal peptidase I